MVAKKSKRPSRKVKSLPSKSLTGKHAKAVRGGRKAGEKPLEASIHFKY